MSTNLPWTTHTGRMREMERVVRAIPEVTGTAFKLFTAVTQGMNEGTGEYHCRDEVMQVTCGVKHRQTLSEARAVLAKKRVLTFEPGRPNKATVYRLPMSDDEIMDRLAMLSDRKIEAKMEAEKDRPRRAGVGKSGRKKPKEIGPGEAAIDDAASGNPDTEIEPGVGKSGRTASGNPDTLLPEPTPSFLATDRKEDSIGDQPVEIRPSEPIILASIGDVIDHIDAHPIEAESDWPSKADLDRGERVISGHLDRLSREMGFTTDEASAVIGDELPRMKQAVAEFPGDGDRAGRRMKKLLANAREQRAA